MLRRRKIVARRANSLRKKFAALRATQRWKRRRWASPGSPSPSSLPRCSSRRGAAAALDVPSEAAGHVLDGPLTCRCLRPWACSHRSPPHAGARTDTLPRARRAPWPRRRTLAVRRQPSFLTVTYVLCRYTPTGEDRPASNVHCSHSAVCAQEKQDAIGCSRSCFVPHHHPTAASTKS